MCKPDKGEGRAASHGRQARHTPSQPPRSLRPASCTRGRAAQPVWVERGGLHWLRAPAVGSRAPLAAPRLAGGQRGRRRPGLFRPPSHTAAHTRTPAAHPSLVSRPQPAPLASKPAAAECTHQARLTNAAMAEAQRGTQAVKASGWRGEAHAGRQWAPAKLLVAKAAPSPSQLPARSSRCGGDAHALAAPPQLCPAAGRPASAAARQQPAAASGERP